MTKNTVWLEKSRSFSHYKLAEKTEVSRPKVNFDTASERTKRMKTQNVMAERFSDELCYADQLMGFR